MLMMPKTALLALTLAIGRGDWPAAVAALAGYYGWRLDDGLEPVMPDGERGDAYAAREGARLGAELASELAWARRRAG